MFRPAPTRRLLTALLFVLPSSSAAIEFSSDDLVYREDYEGETSYPTSPEVDLIDAGGMVGGQIPSPGAPALTGSAAQVSVGGSLSDQFTSRGSGALGTGSFGLRGEFAGLLMTGDGTALAGLNNQFSGANNPDIVARIEVSRAGATDSATLRILERDSIDESTASVALSAADATALLGGAAFTIDLFVDRTASSARASVDVAGFPNTTETTLVLTRIGGGANQGAFQAAGYDSLDPPVSVQIDLEAFETYSSAPGGFNVDVGATNGTPSSSYGAAGPGGVWNTIGLGTTPLVDTVGAATSVSVTLSTHIGSGVGPGTGEALALFGDNAFDCLDPDLWSLSFTGLTDGDYRVLLYAPSNANVGTGDVDVNGTAIPALSGDATGALVEGTSYASVTTTVSGGTMAISASGTGTPDCAGPAGVQLQPLPPKVPVLSPVPRALLAALFLAVTALVEFRSHRRWRRPRPQR